MVFGIGVGSLAFVIVACVILYAVFGRKVLKGMIRVAAILFLCWLAWLWRDTWTPYIDPALDAIKSIFRTATAGPQG